MTLFKKMEIYFPILIKMLGENNCASFANSSYTQLYEYHFSLGLWIRNHLLYNNPDLLTCFRSYGIYQPDDMSDLILKFFYISLHEK